jgi:glycosyltransferase involved in cell wall biosynthesis
MEDKIILSILVPTIPEREHQCARLVTFLNQQIQKVRKGHSTLGDVEVIIDNDKKYIYGGKSVGIKRNDLVKKAQGKYLCFLDDDDTIPSNYIETLLRMAQTDADILTFRQIFKCDFYWSVCQFYLGSTNDEATPEGTFMRSPFHVCPVKSEYAKRVEFSDKNNAEDWEWMSKVLNFVKTQENTTVILHQYNHSQIISAVDEIEHINTKP